MGQDHIALCIKTDVMVIFCLLLVAHIYTGIGINKITWLNLT